MSNMSENVELSLDQWRGATSEELGLTGPQLKTEEHRYVAENGQAFNVFIADARPNSVGPTYLTTTEYDYRMDDLLRAGSSVFATQTKSRVAVSEIPGMTLDFDDPFHTKGARQTPRQFGAALHGDYGPLTSVMLEAFNTYMPFKDGDELHIGGRSMSANMVGSILKNLSLHPFEARPKISRVDFVDAVSTLSPYVLYQLATYEEDMRIKEYLPENEMIGHPLVRFEDQSKENDRMLKYARRTQFPAMYSTGFGLRKGFVSALAHAMEDKTVDGLGLHEADITFARGDGSRVSFEKDLAKAREVVRQAGGDVKLLTLTDEKGGRNIPMAHHALDSVPRLASYAQRRNSNFSR